MLRVAALSLDRESAFRKMVKDYLAHDPENGNFYSKGIGDFAAYVRRLEHDEAGVDLPDGIVPCSHRWLFTEDDEIGAIVRIRHTIDHPFLNSVGGHIGYDVPPSQRGKRYAVEALQAGLVVARKLGIDEVLVCADADNIASCRTIERCGGVLEKEFISEHWPTPVRRYWVKTR